MPVASGDMAGSGREQQSGQHSPRRGRLIRCRPSAISSPVRGDAVVPTIRRFANCKIAIYADDHFPPHFHIEGRGFRAIVAIDTLETRAGDPHRAAEAMKWAKEMSSHSAGNGSDSIEGNGW
jgi:hypothetical protein